MVHGTTGFYSVWVLDDFLDFGRLPDPAIGKAGQYIKLFCRSKSILLILVLLIWEASVSSRNYRMVWSVLFTIRILHI